MEDNKTKEKILDKYGNGILSLHTGHEVFAKGTFARDAAIKAMEAFSKQSTKQLQDRIDQMTEALKWCQKLVDNMPDELYVKIEKLLNTKN